MPASFNVMLVVLGGVRSDHLSCYGYRRETTPGLDRLAQEGVRFTNMTSTAPWSLPAHAALLTGLHSVTHGATGEHPSLNPSPRTLAEYLKGAGYRTAAFSTNPWLSPEAGLGAGFDSFFTQRYDSDLATRAVSFGRHAADRLLRRTDRGARRSNQDVARWLAEGERPFFAMVHYDEASLPVLSPPPFEGLFLPNPADLDRAQAVNEDAGLRARRPAGAAEGDLVLLRALYDGALRYLDQSVGELVETVRTSGAWENTLLVVTGDHGESLGEHGVVGHRFGLHDTVLRVPLIMRFPDRLPAGFVVDELAQTTDVMPTILSLADIDAETPAAQGRALIRDGRVVAGPDFVVAERFRPTLLSGDVSDDDVRMKAIRTRREKYIWRSDEANELYDLVADPEEQENLFETAVPRADLLRRQLFDWLASVQAVEAGELPAVASLESTA